MQIKQTAIGFIGGGNIAQALIYGLLESGVPSTNIMVADPDPRVSELLTKRGIQVTNDPQQLLKFASVVVLAIKPQIFPAALSPLTDSFGDSLIISVAAGVAIKTITELTGSNNVIRAMPNMPALIRAGATGLYAKHNISAADKQIATDILTTAGLVIWVDEEVKMHAITATSGSAPAYFFYFMEAMIDAAQELGLTHKQAKQLVLQNAFGAAKMALTGSDSPTALREKVTSPNGTTQAAIESLNTNKVDKGINQALHACFARSKELAEEK